MKIKKGKRYGQVETEMRNAVQDIIKKYGLTRDNAYARELLRNTVVLETRRWFDTTISVGQ